MKTAQDLIFILTFILISESFNPPPLSKTFIWEVLARLSSKQI